MNPIPNTKKSILLSLIFLVLGCFYFSFFLFRDVRFQKSDDCIRIAVSFIPFSYKPLIKLGIQGKNYRIMLDTGSSHPLDLHTRALEKIQDKEFMQIVPYYDLHGTKYPVSQFRIPEITLDCNLRLNQITAYEENIDFLTKGTNAGRPRSFFGKMKNQLGLFLIDGRLGWPSFEEIVSLFDFPHNSLFLAKNIQALEKEKIFSPEDFIQIPLELSRCGPVLSLQTNLGIKKFLLDTGSSHSVYRESDLQLGHKISFSMIIGDWDFWPYPITSDLSEEIDGVLGIDFFKSHVICLDFQKKHIYIKAQREKFSLNTNEKGGLRFLPKMSPPSAKLEGLSFESSAD